MRKKESGIDVYSSPVTTDKTHSRKLWGVFAKVSTPGGEEELAATVLSRYREKEDGQRGNPVLQPVLVSPNQTHTPRGPSVNDWGLRTPGSCKFYASSLTVE